jgi:D-alanyl-lipoteichoic acid acyltransferase DltB (MBOAT superfamily)
MQFVHHLPGFHFNLLLLPLGISYITFKYMSYLIDLSWGLVERGSFLDFLCYGSLFTIYVAGPIERFEKLKPQLELEAGSFEISYLAFGFRRIVFGLFKKLVLANWLGYFINPVLANGSHYSLLIKIAALFGFSLQIYFDFSGYSDIAIGSSRLFGLRIMENFANPYLAPNISQFWRRWHISLSDWIRDYLFFPLSSGKVNKIWLTLGVPLLAMGLCGLWHGSAWHYMFWGFWHGAGISVYQYWNQQKRKHKTVLKMSKQPWFQTASIVTTFIFVTIGWWWFR